MLQNLLLYGILTAALIGVVWVVGRMLGVPSARRPNGAVTANPWADAEYAFDQALAEHKRRYYAAVLIGRTAGLDLPCIDGAAPVDRLGRYPVGEQVVALRDVVGTVDPANKIFDRDFRPTGQRSRDRFQRIFVALCRGEQLPPIELYRWRGRYYVFDGHHRVAAARAMGMDYLAGDVTDLVGR
jgi:hypothetical protein